MQAVRIKACETLLVTVLLLSHRGLELKIHKFPGACHPGDHTTLNVLGQANMFQLLLCVTTLRLRNVFYVWEVCGQSVKVHKLDGLWTPAPLF